MIERKYIGGHDALPSRFQPGDLVRARGRTGLVSAVAFYSDKVHYQVGGMWHPSEDVMEPMRVAQ